MLENRPLQIANRGLAVIATLIILLTSASAQYSETVLYSFTTGADGTPVAGLIFDAAGNLYGTTTHVPGGEVFELSPDSSGGWTEKVLYAFANGTDGVYPRGGLISDADGNLYGTTIEGGNVADCFSSGCGVVFKLTPNSDGSWTEAVLHRFIGAQDGANPQGALVFDAAGNLYGTTETGGPTQNGVVFKLSPTSSGIWKETMFHAFNGNDGAEPLANVILDEAGNVYGTTLLGGGSTACPQGCGTVFRLTQSSSGRWHESMIHVFSGGTDGANPYGGLIFDPKGNIYGTTSQGGQGWGVVFKLTPTSGEGWRESVLYTFTGGSDGGTPLSALTMDALGNLYGTASWNGPTGAGLVFKLTPSSSKAWTETVLYTFSGGADGWAPACNVIFDGSGNLYGTAQGGGMGATGVAFELTP